MANLLKYPGQPHANRKQQYEYFDDFLFDQSDLFWIDTASDLGSAAVGDAVNGVMVLTPGDSVVSDNDEIYLTTSNELFKYAADKHFIGGAKISWTEVSAGVPNIIVGFMNAMIADSLVDNGAGPRTSGSTAVIYKVDGGTVWRCQTRNNSVATDSISSTTVGTTTAQELEIEVVPFSSTQVKVVFRVDGAPLKDATTGLEIVHTVTVASSTEMHFGMGIKLGGATNNDALSVDYAYYAANRV